MKKELENLKINPADIKRRVNDTLNADLRERKLYMKHKVFKTVLAATLITAVTAVSAFAVSPAGQEAISSIIAYFRNDKATEMTSIEELAKYNREIGKSVSKDGITLTLDNVAADDNFIHVFYTIKSDAVPFYEGESTMSAAYSNMINMNMDVCCLINGELAGFGTNHNTSDGYFVDNYTYKAAEKYNIALKEIPDTFRVELLGEIITRDYKERSSAFRKLYTDNYNEITDEEKAEIWYISADVDKSAVKVETVTKKINTRLPWSGATVEKAVFSPFGNQLVVSTPAGIEGGAAMGENFALYDEKGICLDILNTDLCSSEDGSSRNAFEFLKADKDTKQLKFVPVSISKHGDSNISEQKIGTYPLTYKVNRNGSVVVTDVRISDGQIEIDYYKDGFVMYDPGFVLTDDNGNNAEPGGKLGCTLYTDVHYNTSSYTARYVYGKYDENGKPIPMDDSVSAQALREKFTTLGVFEQMYFELDYDNAVTVNLE